MALVSHCVTVLLRARGSADGGYVDQALTAMSVCVQDRSYS